MRTIFYPPFLCVQDEVPSQRAIPSLPDEIVTKAWCSPGDEREPHFLVRLPPSRVRCWPEQIFWSRGRANEALFDPACAETQTAALGFDQETEFGHLSLPVRQNRAYDFTAHLGDPLFFGNGLFIDEIIDDLATSASKRSPIPTLA